MERGDNLKKLSTSIDGLDTLFHGGIHLNSSPDKGVIVLIKGTKGCNKTLLAMQLMHGLTCSIINQDISQSHSANFISLNKSKTDLSDMYYDLIITRLIKLFCDEWSQLKELPEDQYIQNKKLILECFTDIISCIFKAVTETEKDAVGFFKNMNIIELIVNRVIYYNPRTNNLHYRRIQNNYDYIRGNYGDGEDNKYSSRMIENNEDVVKINKVIDGINKGSKGHLPFHIDDILEVKFKEDYKDTLLDHQLNEDYEQHPLTLVQNIINMLGSGTLSSSCLVIDGFSRLLTNELVHLPYAKIEQLLRKKTKVAILVFDERTEAKMNADIIIDMRKTEATEEEYVYHELQISKSVFQTMAYGWHQYKKRDTGIDVFPSIHMLLSKRNYLPYKLLTMHNNILEESYDDYLGYVEYAHSVGKRDYKKEVSKYYELKVQREYNLLFHLASSCNMNNSSSNNNIDDLKNVLWGNIYLNRFSASIPNIVHGWEDHFPSTAIIGNPNSYKRQFAIAGAFHAAQRKEHTIFILFDKNEADMRRRMRCPALKNIKVACQENNSNCFTCEDINKAKCGLRNCFACYKYIHFFQIRMGCISAEEFFDALLKQISCFSDVAEKKPCHIVIDDLQKIDYSFPFLKKTPLFLSTLVTLCRQNYAELKMICDKRASLVGELCSLSDNVLCIHRDEADKYSLEIYMERNFGGIDSTGLAKYIISDTKILFSCQKGKFKMNNKVVKAKAIGSMKEYWRKSYNVIDKKRRTISIKDNDKKD